MRERERTSSNMIPSGSTIWDLLDRAAQKHPENGLIFLSHELEQPATTVTYPELCFKALVRVSKPGCIATG